MLESLAKRFRVLATQPGATSELLTGLKRRFPSLPDEYVELVEEATEIELQHTSGQYIRIWGPNGCIEMDEGYDISKRIAGAIPIGDNGGGQILIYWNGNNGLGLYRVGYGSLDVEDVIFTAPSLSALLEQEVGIDVLSSS